MNHYTILYIYLIANFYTIYITANYRIEPDATVFPNLYIAYDGCIWRNKIILSYLWSFAFYW